MKITPPTKMTLTVATIAAILSLVSTCFFPALAFVLAFFAFLALYLGVTVKGI